MGGNQVKDGVFERDRYDGKYVGIGTFTRALEMHTLGNKASSGKALSLHKAKV
jgi:hypothetical protein